MPRIARVVAPGYPHHIIQRGNRRQRTFFLNGDYRLYLQLIKEWCAKFSVEIWTYCLMPNHVHLVAVPSDENGLRSAIGEAHRRYTRFINSREGWTGHLWQERFASYVMDEKYLVAAVRYIELNPVRAGLVKIAGEYLWSSARAHLAGTEDPVAQLQKIQEIVPDWGEFLGMPIPKEEIESIKAHASTGRPVGTPAFISGLEDELGIILTKRKPGRPAKEKYVYCPQFMAK